MSTKTLEGIQEAELARIHSREFPYVFSPNKKLFQIVVKMKDVPGALENVLHSLDRRVNLIGSSSYTVEDGSAIFSAFAAAHTQDESAESLKKLIGSSPVAIACQVSESSDGLLVDAFHKGMEMDGGDRLMLFTWRGISGMFDRMSELFGTGAEVMLFYEGVTIGELTTTNMIERVGKNVLMKNMASVIQMLSATGLGDSSVEGLDLTGLPKVRVNDCFECSSERRVRHGCAFVRGLLTGSSKALLGVNVDYEETKCRFKGSEYCEFSLAVGAI